MGVCPGITSHCSAVRNGDRDPGHGSGCEVLAVIADHVLWNLPPALFIRLTPAFRLHLHPSTSGSGSIRLIQPLADYTDAMRPLQVADFPESATFLLSAAAYHQSVQHRLGVDFEIQ